MHFLINFSDRHPYVAHYKQTSQCSTLPVSMTDNESSKVTFLSAIMCTATNMVATCKRMIELGQKKTMGTKRTDSQWLLLYAVLTVGVRILCSKIRELCYALMLTIYANYAPRISHYAPEICHYAPEICHYAFNFSRLVNCYTSLTTQTGTIGRL